jgi:hypothetical protein
MERLNYDKDLVRKHMAAFAHSVENNENWKEYANHFKLPLNSCRV